MFYVIFEDIISQAAALIIFYACKCTRMNTCDLHIAEDSKSQHMNKPVFAVYKKNNKDINL